jgi:outer membrane receptor for ferrienterochelin and colicins
MRARGVLAAALLCASAALADSVGDEADFRFRRGVRLYEEGRVEDALGEFLASNRLVRNRNVILDVARCFERLGMVNEAYRWYSDVLADALPDRDRRDIERALLRLRPRLALVAIESDPAGATIYLDRRDLGARGTTPATLAVPPGKSVVILELDQHQPDQVAFEATVGKEARVHATLEPLYGVLDVRGEPAAFELRVDRSEAEPLLTGNGRAHLPPGRHVLHLSAPGHAAQQLAVEVPPVDVLPVRFQLLRLPPPAATLVVRANVDAALVRVDGREMGFTPAVLEIPVGAHTVEVSAEGREPLVRALRIGAGERSSIDAALPYAHPRVVAAEKSLTRAADAPASVTIVSGDELRAFGYSTLSEALRAVRGFYGSNDRDYESLGARGFSIPGTYNNHVLVLSDGHVTNDALVGQGAVGRDFDADLSDVERIEVVRGPGSVLYGSAAFFAVVNVVHRTPPLGLHGEAAGRVGTLGENSGAVVGSYGAERGYVVVRGSGADLAGEPVFASPAAIGPAQGFAANLDRERAGHLDLRARANDVSLFASYNWRRKVIPTGAFDTAFGAGGTSTLDERGFVEARLDHTFDSGLAVDARASYDGERYHGDWNYRAIGPGTDASYENWVSTELRVRSPPVLGHRLFAGGEAQDRYRVQLLSATPGKPTFANGGATGVPDSERIFSAYAGDDWRIHRRLLLDAAVRIDDYADSFGTVVNPRIALIATPYDSGTTKLIFGRAFRAPGLYERYFNDGGATQIAATGLLPERITTLDVEHTHEMADGLSLLGAAYFSRMENLVEVATVAVNQDGSAVSQYRNRKGPVHGAGVEIELRWQAAPGVLLQGWYAYSVARDDSGTSLFGGVAVPNSPEHAGALRALHPIVSQILSASIELIYGGARHTVTDTVEPDRLVGESLLCNVGLSGEYARWHLRYGAWVFNLLDERISVPGGPEIPFPGHAVPQVGRTLRLQAAASF